MSCCCGVPCQCDGRCNPLVADLTTSTEIANPACENPLPVSLLVDISSLGTPGPSDCFNGSGAIQFKTALTGGVECWEGAISGSCLDCNNTSRTWTLNVTVCCVAETGNLYSVKLLPDIPAVIPLEEQSVTVAATSCNPFLLEGCIPGDITAFVVACISGMVPTQQVFSDVCFQIYEAP